MLYETTAGDEATGLELTIPQFEIQSAAPDIGATVLPIARASRVPQDVDLPDGTGLWRTDMGDAHVAHLDFTRIEALNDHHSGALGWSCAQ